MCLGMRQQHESSTPHKLLLGYGPPCAMRGLVRAATTVMCALDQILAERGKDDKGEGVGLVGREPGREREGVGFSHLYSLRLLVVQMVINGLV